MSHNNTNIQILDPGNYTFITLLYLVQRAEIFLGHQVAIFLYGDFTGWIENCESEDEELPVFFFENIPELFDFFMDKGNCKN